MLASQYKSNSIILHDCALVNTLTHECTHTYAHTKTDTCAHKHFKVNSYGHHHYTPLPTDYALVIHNTTDNKQYHSGLKFKNYIAFYAHLFNTQI